jgi:glycine hydroxymethyltransferase
VGDLIVETLEGLQNNPSDNSKVEENVRTQVKELCDKYPIYN